MRKSGVFPRRAGRTKGVMRRGDEVLPVGFGLEGEVDQEVGEAGAVVSDFGEVGEFVGADRRSIPEYPGSRSPRERRPGMRRRV